MNLTGRWSGSTVAILGSGPSLCGEDVERVKAWREEDPLGRKTIAINTTFRVAPWADALYAADFRWWAQYGREVGRDFKGERWTCSNRLNGVQGFHWIKCVDEPGLSTKPGQINSGGNSGYQAINLAYHQGVARIILLGFDFQPGPSGESHHHGDHEGGLPNPR